MLFFPDCKINLGLDILRRREDGFHDISTVMYPVRGLCDGLEIICDDDADGAVFTSSGIAVDCLPENNLVLRAYELLRAEYGADRSDGMDRPEKSGFGVRMHLHKAIPFGAGLGGGSSDAAFAITGLNTVLGLGLTDDEMERLAARLGSDTAFFVRNQPRLCEGRGEVMSPVEVDLSGKFLLIVKPPINISTAEAYAGVQPCTPGIPLRERIMCPMNEWRECIENAFEKPLFARYPHLGWIKARLYDSGATYASMSGSGSAVYGIFDHSPECDFAGETLFRIKL